MPTSTTLSAEQLAMLDELRARVRRVADQLDVAHMTDWNDADLAVDRYLRLAESAIDRALHHASTGEETDYETFGFVYTALSVLRPDDRDEYAGDDDHLAYAAIRAITRKQYG